MHNHSPFAHIDSYSTGIGPLRILCALGWFYAMSGAKILKTKKM